MIAMVDQTRSGKIQDTQTRGVQPQTGPSIRHSLEGWHALVCRERQLAGAISRQEERLAQLRDRLSPAGILGAFRSVLEVNADIRPGGGHGDKLGDLVAIADEREQDVALSVALLRLELDRVREEMRSLEDVVALSPELHRRVLTLYYRERYSCGRIRREVYVGKTTVYRLIDEGIGELETQERWISGHNQDIIRLMSSHEK